MPKSAGGKHTHKPPKSPKLRYKIQLECNRQSISKKSTCNFNSIKEIFSKERDK